MDTMRSQVLLWLTLSSLSVADPHPCPHPCTCSTDSLISVECVGLSLTSVPKPINDSTRHLNLSDNNLTDLFEQLPSGRDLVTLDLSHNQLKQLGRGMVFSNLTSLRHLDLSHNDFRNLLSGVFRGLHALQNLTITDVHIRFIDEHAFDGLGELRHLDLRRNLLYAVYPEWFSDLPRLENLDLSENDVPYLNGGTFASLTNLRELRLTHNKVRGVNDHAFSGLSNLKILFLDDNHMEKVPSVALRSLPRLRFVQLSHNPIGEVRTGDFLHLPVTELVLAHAPNLRLVDHGAFWDLPNLEILSLDSNSRLQYVDPEAFIGVPSLRILYLHNNGLLALSKDTIHGMRNTLRMTLHGNPLLCDCNVFWIYEILQSNNSATPGVTFLEAEKISCGAPLELQNTPVHELHVSLVASECPPVLIGQINSTVSKKIGSSHVFQCHAYGVPPPLIHWILPGGVAANESINNIPSRSNVHLQVTRPGRLTIFHLRPRDAGTYTCVARNPHGEAVRLIELSVENVDIQLFPLGVSSTFVTVVWNGTARYAFPEYDLMYRREDEEDYKSVRVNQIAREYTVKNLMPESLYQLCLGVPTPDNTPFVPISCTRVRTRDASFVLQGIQRTSNVAVAASLGIVAAMLVVVCLASVAARKYRQRMYETPEKALVANMSQIPLENLYSPLVSHFGP